MTEKDVRMDLSSEHHGGICGEVRIHLLLGGAPCVRLTIAKASSGSFQGDLSLREFLELLDLQSTIGRSVRGHVAIEEAAERKKEEEEASRKQGSWADRSFEQISILAESVQKLTLALTPAPRPARKVRRKAVRR